MIWCDAFGFLKALTRSCIAQNCCFTGYRNVGLLVLHHNRDRLWGSVCLWEEKQGRGNLHAQWRDVLWVDLVTHLFLGGICSYLKALAWRRCSNIQRGLFSSDKAGRSRNKTKKKKKGGGDPSRTLSTLQSKGPLSHALFKEGPRFGAGFPHEQGLL